MIFCSDRFQRAERFQYLINAQVVPPRPQTILTTLRPSHRGQSTFFEDGEPGFQAEMKNVV